ncbi:MAG: hypothetical protein H0T48_07445 [Gemmatimonadaceae bacterium]|nr:hypothetical protein [Gemmatimonadaceae bacterium]
MRISLVLAGTVLGLSAVLSAQVPAGYPAGRDSTQDTTKVRAAPAAPAALAVDFSGIVFAHFQYRGEKGPSQASNRFDVERAYLTFRMPAGERTSVRITTDLYQQTTPGSDSYYRGWTVRAKYAYLQYNYLNGRAWRALARLGLLHTVMIEHDESFWPRWISQAATERAGFFSSADAGLATSLTLPRKRGELYATITNGPGYTSRELDRFKDYAARLTLTPWAGDQDGPLRTVALSAWGYKGAIASKFVSGGSGQVGPVGASLRRDRWGLHAAAGDPRLTFALQYGSRMDEGETGLNSAGSPRNVTDSTGRLISGYAIVRPLSAQSRFGLIGRFDRVITNTFTDARYNLIIAGMTWDFSKRASLALDYQETTPVEGAPVTPVKAYFAHFVARF